jgi:hypothetical protein
MADEYQSTLKGKIKILYQLEKFQDVIKLCEQYYEKYGKDVEIDMMRFKSERRLIKTVPVEENNAKAPSPGSSGSPVVPKAPAEQEPPMLLTMDQEVVKNPAILIMNESPVADPPLPVQEENDIEPFPQAEKLVVADPFAEDKPLPDHIAYEPYTDENELIITEPFDENEPVFSLASNEPPVILTESGNAENIQMQIEPQEEEISIIDESPGESVDTKIAFDFKSNPNMAFDAEPTLSAEPEAEAIAEPKTDAENKSPAETMVDDSVIIDKSAEVWQRTAAAAAEESTDEKSLPLNEPGNDFSVQPKRPPKAAFHFKYLVVLILPLATAAVLWLALSGKLNQGGGTSEKAGPAPVVEPRLPAARRPARKVTPVVPPPTVDESEERITEKINQANAFIKKGDVLNALAVVLEAKKIKATEPLRLLEELITKKIREEESRAAEQKQALQVMAQSEEQSYAKAGAENTVTAWQSFLVQYPQGEFSARARNRIITLEKLAAQKVEQEFQLKIQQAQKLKLRSDYMSFTQAEVNASLQQIGKPNAQFETLEHGGEKVIVDFSSGLMWTLWNKPMVFDKAKWWANRIYAGYAGWRLPTIEESLLLLRMDKALYAHLADFAVWTGDGVGDQVRSVWVLKFPQGQFVAQDYERVCYVWAVRKAAK